MAGLVPVLILLVTTGMVAPRRLSTSTAARLVGAGIGGAALACLRLWGHRLSAWGGLVESDGLAQFSSLMALAGLALGLLAAPSRLGRDESDGGQNEGTRCVILAAVGGAMLLAVSTRNLVVIVGALELVSLGLGWAWAKAGSGMARLRPRGGVVGTVAMLLAVALFYGMSGSFDLAGVETALVAGRMNHHVSVAALGLLLFGIVGKMVTHLLPILAGHRSEGTVWIGCLVVSAQASMLGVLLRATGWFFLLTDEWTTVLWVAAVLAMTLGNVAALIQKDIVRLLAFSSLAHVGYLLVGVVAGGHSGRAAVLFFLPGYVVAACGAFILAAGRSRSGDGTRCSHQKDTFSDLVLSLFVLSLAGLPPAAGFIGKFYLLSAAVQGRDLSLAVIGAFNILVNIYYCVRLVVTLHTRVPGAKPLSRPVGILLKLPLAIASGVVLLLGVLPEPWLSLARRAGLEFF